MVKSAGMLRRLYVGGDKVTYNGVEYTAKWWTQGERPDLGGPWEATSQPTDGNGDVVWQAAGNIYNGGDQVTHQGNKYEAKVVDSRRRARCRGCMENTLSVITTFNAHH